MRGGVRDSAGTDHDNYDHDTDPVTGTTTTQQTTTNSAGTIVTYTPDSDYFMFRTAPNVAPTRYYYTRDTAIVDPEGRTVSWSAIRPDMPATIYYTKVGDRVLVRKVVLSQPASGYQARGNNYYDNDKTLTEKSLRLNQRRPREISRALCCTHVAACDGWSGR